jgi:hypothetical protein
MLTRVLSSQFQRRFQGIQHQESVADGLDDDEVTDLSVPAGLKRNHRPIDAIQRHAVAFSHKAKIAEEGLEVSQRHRRISPQRGRRFEVLQRHRLAQPLEQQIRGADAARKRIVLSGLWLHDQRN